MIKIKCTFYVRRYTEKLFWAKRAMLAFFFLSQIHLLRISFCQNCMSMSQTKNCKLQPCPLGSAQQEIIACFVSKCYPRHVARSKNLGGRVIRGGQKSGGVSSKGGAKIWGGGLTPPLPPPFQHACTLANLW